MLRVLVATLAAAVTWAAGTPSPSAVQPHPPTGSPRAAARDWTPPPADGRFDYQIGGAYRPRRSVEVVDRDRTSHPVAGRYNVCYVNAFQTQAEQDRWWRRHHPHLLLRDRRGHVVEDPGWPGELLLDVGTPAHRQALGRVIGRWVRGCAHKGFDAVEPDNLDSYSRSHHLLTLHDDLVFVRRLARIAHDHGLAIAQKNTAELHHRGRDVAHLDFAIAEECQVYRECSSYLHAFGDDVVEIEYTDNGRRYYSRACRARGHRISVVLRDRDVVPRGRPAYVYDEC